MDNYSIEYRIDVLQGIVLSIFGDNSVQQKINKLNNSLKKEDYDKAFKLLDNINTTLHTMLHTKLGMEFGKSTFMQNPNSNLIDEILCLNDKVIEPTPQDILLFERAFLAAMLNSKNAKYEFDVFKTAYTELYELENYEEQKAS